MLVAQDRKGKSERGERWQSGLGTTKEAGRWVQRVGRKRDQGDLISDRIERKGQRSEVNSCPKRRRNLYFVTPERICIAKSRGMQQLCPRDM